MHMLDILNTFQWKNIALLYEGKPISRISIYNKTSPKPTNFKSLQGNISVITQNSPSIPRVS